MGKESRKQKKINIDELVHRLANDLIKGSCTGNKFESSFQALAEQAAFAWQNDNDHNLHRSLLIELLEHLKQSITRDKLFYLYINKCQNLLPPRMHCEMALHLAGLNDMALLDRVAQHPSRYLKRNPGAPSLPIGNWQTHINIIALNNRDVLIIGESGTSKELMATALWLMSNQKTKEMTTVNCAALPEQLLESTLFGHEKGAFTGALEKMEGLLKEADGGILFLDELGKMPTHIQAKLLRAIETKSYRSIGGKKEMHSSFRVFATVQPSELHNKKILPDLLARLNPASAIEMPPLRERINMSPYSEQVIDLAFKDALSECQPEFKYFLQSITLTPDSYSALRAYDWPGNYRELKDILYCAIESSILRPFSYIERGRLNGWRIDDIQKTIQILPTDIRDAIAKSSRILKGETTEAAPLPMKSYDYRKSFKQFEEFLEDERKQKLREWFDFNLQGKKRLNDLVPDGNIADYHALRRAYQEAFGKKWRERKML